MVKDTHAYDLSRARADLPILETWQYLNTGTIGVMAEPVVQTLVDALGEYERMGGVGYSDAMDAYEGSRTRVATFLGAAPDEITLTGNAMDGINLVLAGLKLDDDDEIILSSEEADEVALAVLATAQRRRVNLRFVPLRSDPDELLSEVKNVLSPRTRLIVLSHVCSEDGRRAPIDVLRDMIPSGVLILADVAQSAGQFPFTCDDLKADYVVGNGHKWLCGPKGTGFMWASVEARERLDVTAAGWESVDMEYSFNNLPFYSREFERNGFPPIKFQSDARRFEYGTRPLPFYVGLTSALDYQETLGQSNIAHHIEDVSSYLKTKAVAELGATVLSPPTFARSSGIVAIDIPELERRETVGALRDRHIALRPCRLYGQTGAIRVSCAYFVSRTDIDALIEALIDIKRSKTP